MERRKNWYLTLGLALTVLSVGYSALGLFWTPYSPTAISTADQYAAPSVSHLFGCDHMGRDVFSRTLEGASATLTIALAVIVIGFMAGLVIGALCGYYGGAADAVVMRICDAIAAFPSVLLGLVILALTGPGKYNVILALGILFIPSFARLVRGEFLKYRDRDFVRAARLMGVSPLRILFSHILPNTRSVLLPALTIGFNNAILSEASMSYLGVGIQPPDASLGSMLSDSQTYLGSAPWYALGVGGTMVLMILGFSLLSEGLQQRSRRSG